MRVQPESSLRKVKCMRPYIIDVHTHVFPDDLAPRAVQQLASRSGEKAYTDGTCAGLKAAMQKHSIRWCVIQPVSTRPQQTPSINTFSIALQNDPQLIPFATLHPDYPDYRAEIARLREAGIRGIKFHPDYQQFYVDAPRVFPLYEAIAEAGLIGLFHAGVDIGLGPPYHGTPDRLAEVISKFPQWTIIAAHFGGFQMWDEVERYLIGRNVFLETSYTLPWIDRAQFLRMVRQHGVEKVLFGSDSPWADQGVEIQLLEQSGLTKDELDKIFHANAAKLLNLPSD